MPYGYLPPNPSIPRDETAFGRPLRPDLPTRFEEFQFVRDELRHTLAAHPWDRPSLLDAACGFEPGVHIFPEIAEADGWFVRAVDLKEPWPGFPPSKYILRTKADITEPYFAPESFVAAVCISALEHMTPETQLAAVKEIWRVTRPGGRVVLTIDGADPHKTAANLEPWFDFGDYIHSEDRLPFDVAYFSGVRK